MLGVDPFSAVVGTLSYGAVSPLKHRLDLMAGGGDAPLRLAANGYRAMANGLRMAAAGSTGSMTNMEVSWRGDASEQAKAAFRRHADWLNEQAVVADRIALVADGGADAYRFADAAVPALVDLLRNIATRAASASLVGTGPILGPMALASYEAAEVEWQTMRVRAGLAMGAYDVATQSLVSSMPDSVPPPLITSGGGGDNGGIPGSSLDSPNSGGGPPGNGNAGTGYSHGADPASSASEGSRPGTPQGSPDSGQLAQNNNGMTPELEQAMQPFDTAAVGDYGEGHELLGQEHLVGTTPYSTTLAGMTGGTGSAVALAAVTGGLGRMSGASTGFRMPSNWNTGGGGTAFGAKTGTATNPAGGPVGNSAPRRGVSAPSAQMRRSREKEESDKPPTVFAAGETYDVPILERPPVIGVIEYADDDQREEDTPEELLVGVLDRFDEETEPAGSERPQ